MDKRYIFTAILITILTAATFNTIQKVKSTDAYLADTEKSSRNSFGQENFTDILELTPGKSKAHYITNQGPFPLVATLENGNLKLDFGEIKAGNSANFNNVFQIKNLSTQSLKIDLIITGEISSLIEKVELEKSPIIKSSQTKIVSIKLKTTPQSAKKVYIGAIDINIDKTSIHQNIPVKIQVL